MNQSVFLIMNTILEEPPTDEGVEDGANRILQQHLSAHAPKEPTDVGRMSKDTDKKILLDSDECSSGNLLMKDRFTIKRGTGYNRRTPNFIETLRRD